jgi:hypothetical protein
MCVYWRKYACSVHVWFKLLNSRAFVVYITKNYPYMFLYKLLSISFKWWICSEGVGTVTVDTHWLLLLCSRHTLQQPLCMVCYSRVINFNPFSFNPNLFDQSFSDQFCNLEKKGLNDRFYHDYHRYSVFSYPNNSINCSNSEWSDMYSPEKFDQVK